MKTIQNHLRNLAPNLAFILALVFLGAMVALTANQLQAQGQNFFGSAVENPFGFSFKPAASDMVLHALADIDGDGDFDNFVSHRQYVSPCWEVIAFEFFENQGTSECPEFTKVPGETFGLPAQTAAITFVDIDNDGDLDAFTSDHCFVSTVAFHKNIGTPTRPLFEKTPTEIINTNWGIGFVMFAFGDLDGDGDYDALVNGARPALFVYLENIGTPTSFKFANPVSNPFGLSIPAFNSSDWAQFTDWDCDGDLDILNCHWQMGGTHDDWLLYLHENKGTPRVPAFTPAVSTEKHIAPACFADMDGDGDVDVFSDEYFMKNISATGCVTLPTASFRSVKNGLTIEFVNESTGQVTDCYPVEFQWDFGDGTTSNVSAPKHTFAVDGTYRICLAVEDIAGKMTTCKDEIMLLSAVNSRYAEKTISMYPNPASSILLVKIDGERQLQPVSVELINLTSEVVQQLSFKAAHLKLGVQVDVSGLANGIYLLKINSEGQFMVARFAKVEL
jgi:hypothetical protein